MPFSSTSFCSILCVAVQSFPPAAGVLRTAADASTPRGSASCADPRGVLLPCLKAPICEEFFVRRHERSLQLHVMLLPHMQASCYCDGSLCGLQLQHVAAGIESCSGDWKRPILRFSFCKGLHIPFVKHLSNVTQCVRCSCHRAQIRYSWGAIAAHWRAPKTKENRGSGHEKPQNFPACRRRFESLRRTFLRTALTCVK